MPSKYIWIAMFFLSVCLDVDATPLDRIIDSANTGNVQAQTQLGVIYATGNGANIDLEEAKKWLVKAAHGGSVEAEYNLGVIYSDSEITYQDYPQAYYWFEKAANNGSRDAQYNLGVMYIEGIGLKPNVAEAEKWFQKSVMNGTPAEQYELAVLYKEGTKLPQDYKKAHFWFETAATYGHMMAQYEVGYMYGEGIGGERNYAKSLEWLHKSARQGNKIAAYEMGIVSRKGLGWRNKATANPSTVSSTPDEQLSVLNVAENLPEAPLDNTTGAEIVTSDCLNMEITSNEQSIAAPTVTSIDHDDVFSEEKNKIKADDDIQDDSMFELSNEMRQSTSTAHHDARQEDNYMMYLGKESHF